LKLGYIKSATVVIATCLLAGCFFNDTATTEIYTEQMYGRIDSLLEEQQKSQQMIQDLRTELAEERESRVRYQAQMGLTLKELEESIRILSSQLEDQALMNQRSGTGTGRLYPLPAPGARARGTPDSAAAGDSARAAGGSDGAKAAEELYRTSYMDITRGNYALAIQGFQNYLVRYPAGAHLSEVHYYLAECYYAEDRHLEAVAEFQYVIREFTDSRLVPAAYLKSGLCYVALEEKNLAEKSFQELIDKHPDTEEAKQAQDELERLQQ
jgi:tol-pal system protein YbgF